jgi:4-amino-4-deoxy-L-arabinose transferase-like glycosyltransferase
MPEPDASSQTPAQAAGGRSPACPLAEHIGFGERSFWPDALVLGGSLFVLLWGLGSYGLYEPHEGHFAGVGREMLLSGDWVTPHLNGSPYLNKPPLVYWCIALSQWAFGINEFGARLPGALFGWLGVVVAWWWGRQLWGPAAGRLAAGFLTVSAGWFIFTHQLLIDAPLATLNLAALYYLWKAAREPYARGRWLLFYLVLALAVLAKGPLSAVFCALALAGLVLITRRWSLLRQAGLWWGVPLMLLPVALWALAAERLNPGFLRHALVNEHWDRLRDMRWPRDYAVSQVGPLGYLGVAAIWCAPWTLFLPQTARFVWRHAQGGGPEGAPDERRDAFLILALGVLGPVLIFLPLPSRLIYYCLPAAPPLALLAAGWWLAEDEARRRRAASSTTLLVCGALAFSAGFWAVPLLREAPELRAAPETLAVLPRVAWSVGAGLFLAGVFMWQRRPRAAAAYLCALAAVGFLFITQGLVRFQDVRSSKNLAPPLDSRLGPDALWVAEGSYELGASAGIAYYLGADERGLARTVRVMTDDPRRPQPRFGSAQQAYAMDSSELQALWSGRRPVLFVTDPMRRDWESRAEAPYLPAGAGRPVATCGFRRVYANAAARQRLANGRP